MWGERPERLGQPADGETFLVDVEGFEGPLDLLLALARTQKVDLARISILALAEQYVAFINEARRLRLELAADYLVMAAWLAYLKSRLLLPRQADDEEPTGEEMAAILAFRLQRLEAMRDAAVKLVNRNRLGRDVFARGLPEGVRVERRSVYHASLYDLLKAYGEQRSRQAVRRVVLAPRKVLALKEAREILQRLVGDIGAWTPLAALIDEFIDDPGMRRTATASTFSASLELCREGVLELRQEKTFGPLYMKARDATGRDRDK
ncbi:ScpA family protein [Microbaculum marinum]|uniref:Segregation and condensation protein A n=1 Tax=Microbaculum marinum TaxID=1764581 RepID=A0AAW9RHY7_9HYPH